MARPTKSGDSRTVGARKGVAAHARAEAVPSESDNAHRSLIDNMLDGYAHCRMLFDNNEPRDFVYLEVNKAFATLTGLTNIVGKNVTEVIPGIKESNPELFAVYGRVALTGTPERFETHIEPLGMWFSVAVYSPAKEYFVALFENITERKRAEQALALIRTLIDRSNDIIEVVDPNTGRLLDVNENGCVELGYSREELLALRVTDLDPGLDATSFARASAQLRKSGTLLWEGHHRRKNGSSFPVEVNISHVVLDREYAVAVVRDITQRKESEQERSRLALAVEQSAEAIMMTDRAGVVVYVNPAFERGSGWARDEVVGQNPRILNSGKQDKAFYRKLWATLERGEAWSGHLINRRKDGKLYEEEAVISPVRDSSGAVINYVAVKRDVTQERLLESQLLQAQKMEAIGRLAGGVAHDFNNLLTAIMGYGQLMKRRFGPDDLARRDAEEILKAAARGASLTRQLLLFSRQQVVEFQALDLNTTITGMDKMLRRLVGEDIDLATAPVAGSCGIWADAGQLEQVLMNLAVNARDAMPEGGKLTIETAIVELDATYAGTHFDIKPGRYAMLAVSDTGTGMTPEVKAHVFEPFFTTKDPGKGTGLGLSTVHGIVSKSGGHIEVYTQPGQGTTFKVYLPVAEQSAQDASTRSAGREPRGGSETLLLVEDEEPLRRLMCESLALHGYTVLEARDGSEAIGICERLDQVIDLLVTDLVMPLMNGPDLARRVALTRPDLRVLFVSGYTDQALVHQGARDRATAFLQKPFMPETLAHKVRETLDQPRQDAA